MHSLSLSLEHYLVAMSADPGAKIISSGSTRLNLKILESTYTAISAGIISSVKHEVLGLPPVLCMGGPNFMSLGAENAPLSIASNHYYLNGVSFATTPVSLKTMMEPYTDVGHNNVPNLHFSEEIVCIASYDVFGHFLLQTCLKLLVLKILGRLHNSLVVFTGFLPHSFQSILAFLGLLPQRYLLVPAATNLLSTQSCGVLLSPIHTVSTPLCNLILGHQDSHDSRYLEGQHLTSSTWLNPRRGINYQAASLLRQTVLAIPVAKQCKVYEVFPRLYLARKPSVHRSLANREHLLPLLHASGYKTLYLEDFPIDEQFRLLLRCEHLVCDVGSTSCNTWLMPHLQTVIELALTGAAIPWGPVLDSAVRPIFFIRILGTPVPGTMKRHDGDNTKAAMAQDTDYTIDMAELSEALLRIENQ